MPTIELRLDDLGQKGLVTDVEPADLDHRSLVAAQNMVLENGVPSSIQAMPEHPDDYRYPTEKLGGAWHLREKQLMWVSVPTVGSNTNGRIRDWFGGFSSGAFAGGNETLPLIEHGGEVLWFDQSGIYPVVRWAGLPSLGYVGLTGSVTNGSAAMDGPPFPDTQLGMYIGVQQPSLIAQPSFRIEFVVNANGNAKFAEEWDALTVSSSGLIGQDFGYLGLLCPVRRFTGHLVSTPPAPDVLNIDEAGDSLVEPGRLRTPIIATIDYLGQETGSTKSTVITARTWNQVTLWAGTTAQSTAIGTKWQVGRNMVGRCGCLHKGRLYVASPAWMPNAVFEFPPGYGMGKIYNGIDSPTTSNMDARMCKYVHVPDPDTTGRVVALMSTGAYMLVLRSDSTYTWSGNYPSPRINQIWQGDGCVDVRSAIQTPYGQVWAGRYDIYVHDRGGIFEMTRKVRQAEWMRRVDYVMDANSTGRGYVSCTCLGRYLLVASTRVDGTIIDSETWCYDLELRVWCGNVTGLAPVHLSPASQRSGRDVAGMVHASGGATLVGESVFEPAHNMQLSQPGFSFETGALAGLGDNDRLTNLKVSYELVGPTGTALPAGLVVSTCHDGRTFGRTRTFTALSPGAPLSARTTRAFSAVSPTPTGSLGQRGNQVRLKFEGSGNYTRARVHGVKAMVRKMARRA